MSSLRRLVRPTPARPTLRSGRHSQANGRGTTTRPGGLGSSKARLTSTRVASKPKRRQPDIRGAMGEDLEAVRAGRANHPTMVLLVKIGLACPQGNGAI